ncbi:hypothetical protein F8271_29240 [Micromonospora sp. ALFpr18c]|uniref:DUF6069 family protein n=1 Tax=unclassified Micromonospora TaxID=2617518 RepID=UPI00124BA774|nr:DUF6069 family protein [Micromonospora sp. ALFpr18c]KAB1927978.1 hypothetical protein F8271_29240 [Micromonospora sp. ALFpr18c]
MSAEASTTRAVSGTSRARTRAIAIVAAVVGAVVVWLIAKAAGAELKVDQGSGPQDVSVFAVVLTAVFAGLFGWALLALLEKFTARAKAIWTTVAVVVLLISLVLPLLVDATTGTKVALVLMHLTVGAIVIQLFRKDARSA